MIAPTLIVLGIIVAMFRRPLRKDRAGVEDQT